MESDGVAFDTYEAAEELGLPKSFTPFHARLFDLCLSEISHSYSHESTDAIIPPLESENGKVLTLKDLSTLALMTEREFVASLRQDLKGPTEASDQAEPHVFDVYLMKITLDSTTLRRSAARKIAVVVPYKRQLLWWNGSASSDDYGNTDHHFWSIKPDKSHVRKIASLAGVARVLGALSEARKIVRRGDKGRGICLVASAMQRQGILSVAGISEPKTSFFGRLFGGATAPLSSIVEKMNPSQRRAVDAVAHLDEGFLCIHGPPGTGKTTTMVGMILTALQAQRGGGILVTAPSNAAVANVAIKLHATGQAPFGQLIVFGENCDSSVHFLNPKYRSMRYSKFYEVYDKLCDEAKEAPDEKSKARANKKAGKLLEDFVSWLHLDSSLDWSLAKLSRICPHIELEDDTDSTTIAGRKVMEQLLGRAGVVFCTLNSAGSFTLQTALEGAQFTTMMLDEGGQCTEAEFFIATTFPGLRRLVIMGDPKQLAPTVIDPACAAAGYGYSFLGRVFQASPNNLHLLDTQYRMDPAILEFPNKRFYKNRIQSGNNVLQREPVVAQPFQFVDTMKRGREESVHSSYQNQYEVAVINIMLRSDKDIKTILQNGDADTKVIIITPYKAQMLLLQKQIKLPNGSKGHLVIATVDSFQGQEADIVIVTTVRTRRVGFTDDPQRLNVALTRAKRILRVVGDRHFFENLPGNSTLKALVRHASNSQCIHQSQIKGLPFCPPDWSRPMLWKMALTQRFHDCVLKMKDDRKKNICFNTLVAIATPDLKSLKGGRVPPMQGWKLSCLSGGGSEELYVVWIVRANKSGEDPTVEAHYAGEKKDCLRFAQKNHKPPSGSLPPKDDMSGVVKDSVEPTPEENGTMFTSWKLDNGLQRAILSGKLPELPSGMLELDPPQAAVAMSDPPLLIESRSGTGKTLVLLQHAALKTRHDQTRPACFVTVSQRLKEELKQKYEEHKPVLFDDLPETQFFAFRELLDKLLDFSQVDEFRGMDICTFYGYSRSRKSHERQLMEPQLIENEVGGVIMGSLPAAKQKAPLGREEYLVDKRSNISNKSTEGKRLRELVYDEYTKYVSWKRETSKFDIADVVLRLLKENLPQVFSSAYLDEVQDLSHASIYLICSIAGKDSLHWVAAGDPAQMISPGCSFTFDGLKQTFLSVAPGIEAELKDVHHLVVNYRTTKDILTMANTILDIAKKKFPNAIEYALPETAKKDLGLKVVMCRWRDAMTTNVKFGRDQAFVFAPSDSLPLQQDAETWLKGHPFILSSLESKGLEFQDVVVAFDFDRKTWDVSRKLEGSLRMLRELYVAVTRAQRRVVILIKNEIDNMHAFFRELDCEEMQASVVFQEFNRETTSEQWFDQGVQHFDSAQFELASRCFTRAGHHGWSFLAKGEDSLRVGLKEKASEYFHRAVTPFQERQDTKKVLDLLKKLVDTRTEWDAINDDIFSQALQSCPRHLPRVLGVEFHLIRGNWNGIKPNDLADRSLASLFGSYRKHSSLMDIVRRASDGQRREIEQSLPWAHADYQMDQGNFLAAVRIFLDSNEGQDAADCSERIIAAKRKDATETLLALVDLWKEHTSTSRASRVALAREGKLSLLLQLFGSTDDTSSSRGSECLASFGKDLVRHAVEKAGLDFTCLLTFGADEFKEEVTCVLEKRFEQDSTLVVDWFLAAGYQKLAVAYVTNRHWPHLDLLRLVLLFRARPKCLFRLLKDEELLEAAAVLVLRSRHLSEDNKSEFFNQYRAFDSSKVPGLVMKQSKDHSLLYAPNSGVLWRIGAKKQYFEELFFICERLGSIDAAVNVSIVALSSHELAAQNVSRILHEWEERGGLSRSAMAHQKLLLFIAMTQDAAKETKPGKLSEPFGFDDFADKTSRWTDVSTRFLDWVEEICAVADLETGFWPLVKAFGPVAATYVRLADGRHDEGFLGSLCAHHKELLEKLALQRQKVEGGRVKAKLGAGTKSAAGPTSNEKTKRKGKGKTEITVSGTHQAEKGNKKKARGNKKKKRNRKG
ncbi:polymerase alpha-associated DNA helicase A [Seminavis robusta]|uniref:Polymerase alpha-associated DNA helicase A n=1 Tax=Seminavis robusta TaxID=568900 RepID=A0A9N8HGF6_9STRA|nr:polymerase alpha-associated DNA helicase A [Seminavis robusta]|eukprot:Sro575_g169320.1 polymerase alpha-associated DNA helicase A (2003) ;mRNA; r:18242-24573